MQEHEVEVEVEVEADAYRGSKWRPKSLGFYVFY